MSDRIPILGPTGEEVAALEIWGASPGPADAAQCGESVIQLQEQGAYEYRLSPNGLRLCCPYAKRSARAEEGEDFGRIETRSFCGNLRLQVERAGVLVGSTFLTVRSEKVDYRTHYRGMVRYLSERFETLAVEARNASRVNWESDFEERRRDLGWVQLQIEFLRQVLDDPEFAAAVQRVIQYPHERLERETVRTQTNRAARLGPSAIRQLATGQPRMRVPEGHPLRRYGLETVAEQVDVERNTRTTDTPENRFVRFALREFEWFLDHVAGQMRTDGWAAVRADAERLQEKLAEWLSRSFFQSLGELRHVPFGSPVLQRKAGYREIYRTWLRFRTSAQITWSAGEDLFAAGQRDVASLYEYWLFFVLLDWFCEHCGATVDLDELFEQGGLELRLRRGFRLGPFVSEIQPFGRRMKAAFSFNQTFGRSRDSAARGSWTRQLRPDYTFTFWPAGLEEAEAERLDLLVHVHFDAKYRVEGVEALFGRDDELADELTEEDARSYKRQDLLKMHAYRDAIRRSEGAYVLFPGEKGKAFRGYQEILPGLGAFGIRPDADGRPDGIDGFTGFMKDLLEHLGSRGTSREHLRHHRYDVYVRERPATYDHDPSVNSVTGEDGELTPPVGETLVLVGWVKDAKQFQDVQKGTYYVRFGRRRGSVRLTPRLASVTKVLLRGEEKVYPGLYAITEPGIRVMSRGDLIAAGLGRWTAGDEGEDYIYGVFDIAPDPDFEGRTWSAEKVMERLEAFERDRKEGSKGNLGRNSAIPRVMTLDYLLPALEP